MANFIAGEFAAPASGAYIDGHEPATGQAYCRVPDSDSRDIERAVAAAEGAFAGWAATPARERAKCLRRIAAGIEARLEDLARAESVDTGKPIAVARSVDIPRAALNFEFFADAATQFASELHSSDGRAINYTLRHPLGVVACISPWNLPLYLLSWKIAPALAAGNCVVAKPSEITPMTAHLLGEVCREAGLPAGVLNIVQGTGARTGDALIRHPRVRAISFTGSTKTGGTIAQAAAESFKKVSLEMGGKNPSIIFADADLGDAIDTTVRSAFSNQGQICLCGSRIFIERPIYERFKSALVEKTRALRIGDPLDPATQQGSVVSQPHFEKVMSYIELAREEGGAVLTGGKRAKVEGRCAQGWFIEPTLIEGLGPHCRVNQEEIFGPVATLMPFDDEAEVLEWANSTRYGLAANVWTRDLDRAHRFSARLHSGIVWVNCWMLRDLRTPFGGVKDSGVGREGGWDAMRFFTEPQNICIQVKT